MPQTNVAIVGGGLAGLSAAYLLRKRAGPQVNINVFEASDRFGGRVRTLRQFDQGLHAEAGGMVFTDTEPKIAALVKEMGLEIVPRPDAMQRRYYFDSQWNDGHAVNELMGLLVAEIQQLNKEFGSPSEWSTKESATLDKLDSISIVDYLVQKIVQKSAAPEDVKPEDVRRTLSATLVGLYPDNLDDLSALAALRVISQYVNSKQMYSIKKGNDLLPKALASSLNERQPTAFLNKPVNEVVHENNQWKINFADQTAEFFDHVIIATPLSMLQSKNAKAIKLPDLPAQRRQMLDEIPYTQSMVRVFTKVKQRFWQTGVGNANVVTNQPTFWIEDHTAVQAGPHAVIEAHACNKKGRDIQQDPDPKKAGQQALASVYGQQFTKELVPGETCTVIWKNEPYQQGAYPYSLKGQRRFWGQLGKPLIVEGNNKGKVTLLFAGEYTATNTPMSMNGAVESAHRVVGELLLLSENTMTAVRTAGLFAPQRASEELVSQQTENKPASLGL